MIVALNAAQLYSRSLGKYIHNLGSSQLSLGNIISNYSCKGVLGRYGVFREVLFLLAV